MRDFYTRIAELRLQLGTIKTATQAQAETKRAIDAAIEHHMDELRNAEGDQD